ncbi:MAG: hypothetical protein RL199_1006 [Pseudomonadota bacterium]|jgi:hypothetical protein
MSRRSPPRPAELSLEQALDTLHHAAFELRETDPAEAVKVLRKLVKQGGEVEGLAHGALGEILLEVFEDVDGALHHYRRLVALAPAVPAGHQGLARALAAQGDVEAAKREYALARAGLETMLDEARTAAAEPPPGIEEGLLNLFVLVDELRGLGAQVAPVAARFLDWAEEERLFDVLADDPDDDKDLDDWMRYGVAAVSESVLTDGAEAGVALVERLAALIPFEARQAAQLRSHAYEATGRFGEAAKSALEGIGDIEGAFEYEEVARAAALLERAGRGAEAKELLLRLSARLRREFQDVESDEDRAVLESLLTFVDGAAAETGPRLVPIKLGGLEKR